MSANRELNHVDHTATAVMWWDLSFASVILDTETMEVAV